MDNDKLLDSDTPQPPRWRQTTADLREAAFRRWWEEHGQPYDDAKHRHRMENAA